MASNRGSQQVRRRPRAANTTEGMRRHPADGVDRRRPTRRSNHRREAGPQRLGEIIAPMVLQRKNRGSEHAVDDRKQSRQASAGSSTGAPHRGQALPTRGTKDAQHAPHSPRLPPGSNCSQCGQRPGNSASTAAVNTPSICTADMVAEAGEQGTGEDNGSRYRYRNRYRNLRWVASISIAIAIPIAIAMNTRHVVAGPSRGPSTQDVNFSSGLDIYCRHAGCAP